LGFTSVWSSVEHGAALDQHGYQKKRSACARCQSIQTSAGSSSMPRAAHFCWRAV
jgi:hypothetical protein